MKQVFAYPKNKLHLTAWRKRLWCVWEHGTWYKGLIHFCNRNAAIMWLKRYGDPKTLYMLGNKTRLEVPVRVVNNYVFFFSLEYGLMITAESKRTCPFAVRNN